MLGLALFFFKDSSTTGSYTLSLHDALPISFSFRTPKYSCSEGARKSASTRQTVPAAWDASIRSEEHTSELQSRVELVCRALLEKKDATAAERDLVRRCRDVRTRGHERRGLR